MNTLYQFWNLDWCDSMFAWVYMKTLDDGKDYWVVGTGCSSGRVLDRYTLFYDYITKEFHLDGAIVKKEGYSHSVDLSSKDRVWLGEGRVLAVGDAAGLIDQTRGVGMDSAALSGRLAAQALVAECNAGVSVHEGYCRLMGSLVGQTRRNQGREITGFGSNEELQRHLESSLVKAGVGMVFYSAANRLRPLSKIVMLPP
jgi:flavin-dependent dehydrogenase